MFFNSFNEEVREIFNQDKDKYLVLSWIIFNANYQEEYNGLGMYECYFTHGLMAKIFSFSKSKSAKIIDELIEEKHIEWVKKSTSKHDKSIIKLLILENGKKNGRENREINGNENDESIDSQGECEPDGMVGGTVNGIVGGTVKVPLSKNLSKNLSNQCVYKPLIQAPHVKLTEEQYNALIQEHGSEYIENIILDLENYIVNGDGAKYTDHNLAIRSWIRYRQACKPNKESQSHTGGRVIQPKQTYTTSQAKLSGRDKFTSIHQHNWNMSDLEKAQELLLARNLGEITEDQYQQEISKISFG